MTLPSSPTFFIQSLDNKEYSKHTAILKLLKTMAETISAEEAQKTFSEEANDDEFKDAVEEEEVADGCFEVTTEEMSIIRAELACEFPDDYTYLSDAYVMSVASKPYSKDPTVRRPLEVRERVDRNSMRR
jgi:hypothetical protein